ncbi:hypothetical protein K9L27_02520 [Candidatus Gracilibacteria bacterium]|nr:hypothetical protein [Candidatus Gracilibacteria bacterium]
MGEESVGGIDDLMMGNDSEGVRESDEKFRERLAAAQAKLAQVHKDESKSKDFDLKLAKLIPRLHRHTLKLVVFLIDNDIPSLTILAMISLESNDAGKICHMEFHKYIEEKADVSLAKLDEKSAERISLWWTYIFAADHVSRSTRLQDFQHREVFVEFLSLEFSEMLKRFLTDQNVEHFDANGLNQVLQKYQKMMFETEKGGRREE